MAGNKLGPSLQLTVAYTPSVRQLYSLGLHRGIDAYTPSDPTYDSILSVLFIFTDDQINPSASLTHWQVTHVLHGGRKHSRRSVLPGSRHALSSPAAGMLCPPQWQAHISCPPWRQADSLLRSSRHSILSSGRRSVLRGQARSVLPGGRHTLSSPAEGTIGPHACFDVGLCPRRDGNPGSNGLVRVAVVGTFTYFFSFPPLSRLKDPPHATPLPPCRIRS